MGLFYWTDRRLGSDEAFFLQRTESLGANLELDFLTVDHDSLGLQVGLPNLLGVALRKADVVAVLLSFAGDVTLLHSCILKVTDNSAFYSTVTA